MEAATYVTIAMFMAGVIFTMGRVSARVEALESWRTELRGEIVDIRHSLGELLAMARNRRRE